MAGEGLSIKFKWSGRVIDIVTHPDEAVEGLKRKLEAATTVLPQRQKLLGLKTLQGKAPSNGTAVRELALKPGMVVMMLGDPEADIAKLVAQSDVVPEVQDDFDVDPDPCSLNPAGLQDEQGIRERLERRILKTDVKTLQPPRPGKKLLVLDIDYTLFDLGSAAERPEELARPFLHFFLAKAYSEFDIAIWSATSMKWIEVKMKELGVLGNPDYKLTFMLDHFAMLSVNHDQHGMFDCKPLEYVWAKFPGVYTRDNTIMMDDLRRNYVLNPQNGLVIRPFRKAHRTRDRDRELLYLSAYLEKISKLDSLAALDHDAWEAYAADEIRDARKALARSKRVIGAAEQQPEPEGGDSDVQRSA